MQQVPQFLEYLSPVEPNESREVAVVGGDTASVVIAYVLSRRGHNVVWYRGQDCNPHPSSGVLRTYAVEPLALPGYPLGLLSCLSRTAVRGKLQGEFSKTFIGWILRAVAQSRPLMVEAIAKDRSAILAQALAAYEALSRHLTLNIGSTEVVTLYSDARAYASGWSVHDVRKRHGVACEEIGFDDIASRFPHLSPRYTHGVVVPDVPVVENAEAVMEEMKSALEQSAEIVRHWPQTIQPEQGDHVAIHDNGDVRCFDWVVRGDDGGPSEIWPAALGASPLAQTFRERHLLRRLETVDETQPTPGHQVLIDGYSGAWMEQSDKYLIAAGAQCTGGYVEKDLRYLNAASYARLWRELAGAGWHAEGGRIAVARGSVMADSRPTLGVGGGRILEASGFGELSWTLGGVAGFAMAGFIEGHADELPFYKAFAPGRF